jgi:hypothetical protein
MMATSRDGINWEKPEFDFIKYKGLKTNVIDIDIYRKGFGAVIPSIILNAKNEWEMFYWAYHNHNSNSNPEKIYYLRAVSQDGIRWLTPEPDTPIAIHTHQALSDRKAEPFDVSKMYNPEQDFCIPQKIAKLRSNDASFMYRNSDGSYDFYGVWLGRNYGISNKKCGSLTRCIQKRTSPNGYDWSNPVMIFSQTEEDLITDQLYYFSVTQFKDYYIGLLGVYHMDLEKDIRTIEPYLAVSYDGLHWRRFMQQPFVPLGQDGEFDAKMIMCPDRLIDKGDKWYLLYGGCCEQHVINPSQPEPHTGKIGLVSIPKSRLIGVYAENAGTFRTKPFFFAGSELEIDACTFDNGNIKAEITDPLGQPVPGFSSNEAVVLDGDLTGARLIWKDFPCERFKGEMISLRFYLDNAQIFNINMK